MEGHQASKITDQAWVEDADTKHVDWLRDRIGRELIESIVVYAGERAYRRPTTSRSYRWLRSGRDRCLALVSLISGGGGSYPAPGILRGVRGGVGSRPCCS